MFSAGPKGRAYGGRAASDADAHSLAGHSYRLLAGGLGNPRVLGSNHAAHFVFRTSYSSRFQKSVSAPCAPLLAFIAFVGLRRLS